MAFGQPDIQALINQGLGYGAAVLGETCQWFRPYAALAAALDPAARMGIQTAYFDPDAVFKAGKPAVYGKAVYAALMDRTLTQPGDYLDAASGVYFIAQQQPLLPTVAVKCSATITVTRRPKSANGMYSGRTDATDQDIIVSWPASVLSGGRTQASRADLPGDVPDKGYLILLPAFPGAVIQTSDRITDDQGRTFTVSGAEMSDLGYRLDAVLSAN